MACRGRWRATSSTKSPVPSRLAAQTIRCACSRRPSSSPARARGVKHRFPTLRTRVCRGGSMQRRRFFVDSPVGSDASSRRTKAELVSTDHPGLLVTAVTSTWRVTDQNPPSSIRPVGRLRVPPDRLMAAQPGELVQGEMIGEQVGITQIETGIDRRRGHDGRPPGLKPLGARHRKV